MGNLQIQNPNKEGVLPVFGERKPYRLEVDASQAVKRCIATDLLLTKGFYLLLTKILSRTKQIRAEHELLKGSDDYKATFKDIEGLFEKELEKNGYNKLTTNAGTDDSEEKKGLLKKAVGAAVEEFRKQRREKLIEGLIKLNNELEAAVDDFGKEHSAIENNLNLLTIIRFFVCKKCFRITSRGIFKKSDCRCGAKITGQEVCQQVVLSVASGPLMKFIDQNMWLEHGVNQMLDKMGYDTSCGINLLGSSGVFHEIDVIAQKGNTKILVECKNREIRVNDILIFYGKMMDLGIPWGYVFTVDGNVSPEVKKMAISKNIIVVDSVLVTEKSELEDKILTLEKIFSRENPLAGIEVESAAV